MIINEGDLFPDFFAEPTMNDGAESGKLYELNVSAPIPEKSRVGNLHLCNSFTVDGNEELPLVSPYNGELPRELVAYGHHRKYYGANAGLHFYEADCVFDTVWSKPVATMNEVRKFRYVIAPDNTLFVDQAKSFNILQLYKNRWVTCYWQQNGVNVIPSASWGNADSLKYCFDGLPENSIIAIGHSAVGRTYSEKLLYRMAVKELVERKNPTKLVVYGFHLDFDPEVEVVYYDCLIQKLRTRCL